MPMAIPSLLRLIGEGFRDDEYAADGMHLRWMFHPALGFSRYPYCLERRPSVATKRGRVGIDWRSADLRDISDEQSRVVRGDVTVTRHPVFVGFGGFIPLIDGLPPVDIRFGGAPQPQAAWARVHLQLSGPSHATVEAYHDSGGELRLVDRATTRFRPFQFPRPISPRLAAASRLSSAERRLTALLDAPATGVAPPRTREPELRTTYDRLVDYDPGRYRNVNAAYLREVTGLIMEIEIGPDDLVRLLPKTKMVHLDVFGDHIDFVRISGHGAVVMSVDWALAVSLADAEWEEVDCYSALTDEPDYVENNQAHLPPGLDLEQGTTNRLSDPLPHGAEPMDDPQVAPSRGPTLGERMARYGKPWLARLEPWMEMVLAESLGGAMHMSEVTMSSALTEFGQKPGDGIPTLPAGVPAIDQQTQRVRPYGTLLAASMAFPNAQLMGLATVDLPPSGDELDMWDYRLTGWWRVEDLEAYRQKLETDFEEARDAVAAASPTDLGDAIAAYLQAFTEFSAGSALIGGLVGIADASGLVALQAYAGGLVMSKKARFAAPSSLDVSYHELASPSTDLTSVRRRDRAVAHLEWPLPARKHQIERLMPMLATLARRDQGSSQPFDTVLNSADPDFGIIPAVVPLDSEQDETGIATADYFDRDVASGAAYRYGVTQSDLFGRWSSFTEREFSWVYDIPPPPPLGVTAALDEVGTPSALRLTVEFKWPHDLYPGDEHSFSVYMSRVPLGAAVVHDPSTWNSHGMRRIASTGAAPFQFAGDFSGNDSHDGMPVTVSFTDSTETDPAGITKTYRNYRVRFRGVQLDRVDELARCFTGVRSHDVAGIDGDEVAGPARADHYDPDPPAPPPWPPEPLQASFADADGQSTFDLTWAASPTATYEVFRVGERDLVARLQSEGLAVSGYDRDDPANFRAAALKALAVNPATRQAFTRRSELGPGVGEFRDRLPGYVSTLYFYVVLSRSVSGVASGWPSSAAAFLAVEVPRAPLPDRPVVLSARWVAADGPGPQPLGSGDRVEITIAEPPAETAAVASYEVYRTISTEKAKTMATMRLLHRLEGPVFDGPPGEVAAASYIDPHIDPWTTYHYRVVARAPGSAGGVGMRSEPSTPVRLTTLGSGDPSPPTIDSVLREPAGPVVVGLTAEAHTTPAGDFIFDVITRAPDQTVRHTTVRSDQARVGGTTYEIRFDDTGVSSGAEVYVRVTTPLGAFSESAGIALPPL